MRLIVLDTNVVSELARSRTDPAVAAWMSRQPTGNVAVTTLTLFELQFGIHLMPPSRRRRNLESFLEDFNAATTSDRILSLDPESADRAAAFRAARQQAGRPVGVPDALIAGIALRAGAALATRNVRDFADSGLALIDPWQAAVA